MEFALLPARGLLARGSGSPAPPRNSPNWSTHNQPVSIGWRCGWRGRGKTVERCGWVWTLRGPSGLGVSTLWGSFTLLVTSASQTQARRAGRLPEADSGPFEQRIPGFPGDIVAKTLHASAGDTGDTSLIPGSGRSPAVGNGDQLQDSCLEHSMNRRSLVSYSPRGHKESDMTE